MDIERIAAGKPTASRYWHYPQHCHHNYVVEYLTASSIIGSCRGCGTPITVRQHLIEKGEV